MRDLDAEGAELSVTVSRTLKFVADKVADDAALMSVLTCCVVLAAIKTGTTKDDFMRILGGAWDKCPDLMERLN